MTAAFEMSTKFPQQLKVNIESQVHTEMNSGHVTE